jgi:hypothetical protein
MSLIDNYKPGTKLVWSDDYNEMETKREFWGNSYEMERSSYFEDGDAEGKDVVIRFDCEELKDYNLRKRNTPIRNYCSQIINKFNSSVFRNYPIRPWEVANPDLAVNVDLLGNSADSFFKMCLKVAQIEGECWVIPDSTSDSTGFVSEAQKSQLGIRPFFRVIENDNIVDYEEINGTILEVAFIIEKEDGMYLRWYDSTNTIEWKLQAVGSNYNIGQVTFEGTHGYSQMPVVRLKPLHGEESQISPLAENQKQIINYLSLLNQEISDSTFTRFILSGIRLPEDGDGTTKSKVTWGAKRITVLEDQGAKLESLGADKNQADSIRESIKNEEESLYRVAGLSASSYSMDDAKLSGVSRLIAREDYYLIVKMLSSACEHFENTLIKLIWEIEGRGTYEPVVYSDDFAEPDIQEAILKLRDILALALPQVIKNKAIKEFSEKFFSLSEEDMATMEQQLNSGIVQ